MGNRNLTQAKRAKNDEFYTQWHDIEREVNAYLEYDENVFRDKVVLLPCDDPEWSNFTKYFAQNFERFGLKKLISTSYGLNSEDGRGKVFTLYRDVTGNGKIDVDGIEWEYLDGDGDFRSDEVIALRDECDIVVTNPPFSLFREFVEWINEGEKDFLILGNMNAITYKEIFPLIKENKMWLGVCNGAKEYRTPDGTMEKMGNTVWFTNLQHGRRHQPLSLMTMADNLKFNTSLLKKLPDGEYQTYDNYDAIEVPMTIAIPSDYEGVMGVPISFLTKYCPEQFEIVGCSYDYGRPEGWDKSINMSVSVYGKNIYKRILIKHKNPKKEST